MYRERVSAQYQKVRFIQDYPNGENCFPHDCMESLSEMKRVE